MNEKDYEVKVLLDIYNSPIDVVAFGSDRLTLEPGEATARAAAISALRLSGLIVNVVGKTYKLSTAGWKAASIINYSLNKTKDDK